MDGAPFTYVKVCDAYGAGFYTIPGTDTCIKVGGRARYDLGFTASGNYFDKDGKKIVNVQDTWGQHVRGRVDLDSRTPTAYGTAQTVVSIRMNQSSGVLGDSQSPTDSIDTSFEAWKYNKYATSMEAAYIRFAGLTFGRAKEIFAQGHSLAFGANSHFPSFSNGALQLSYTALLGGGLSAQIGIEDNGDLGNQNLKGASAPYHTPYNKMPAVAGNLRWEQGWGTITASLGYSNNRSVKYDSASATSLSADLSKSAWAAALWTTINLDMLSKGDKLWLMGGYSDGVTGWGYKDASNASSSNARDITGIGQSYKNITCDYTAKSCQNTKTTWVSAALEHYWSPSVRQNLMAGYAKVDPGSLATAGAATTQKASFTSVGSNIIWSPTKNFDLGLEALYNRQNVSQITTTSFGCGKAGAATDCKYSGSNMFYRFRAERTF